MSKRVDSLVIFPSIYVKFFISRCTIFFLYVVGLREFFIKLLLLKTCFANLIRQSRREQSAWDTSKKFKFISKKLMNTNNKKRRRL